MTTLKEKARKTASKFLSKDKNKKKRQKAREDSLSAGSKKVHYTIFISGPMSGYKNYNFEHFDEVERKLRAGGHDVVNPAEVCRRYGQDKVVADKNMYWLVVGEQQKEERAFCNAIILLEGWERSIGVRLELRTALELGFIIFQEKDLPALSREQS